MYSNSNSWVVAARGTTHPFGNGCKHYWRRIAGSSVRSSARSGGNRRIREVLRMCSLRAESCGRSMRASRAMPRGGNRKLGHRPRNYGRPGSRSIGVIGVECARTDSSRRQAWRGMSSRCSSIASSPFGRRSLPEAPTLFTSGCIPRVSTGSWVNWTRY
jgi:hypothetical protein